MKNATPFIKLITVMLFCSLCCGALQAQQSVNINGDSLAKNECPLPANIYGDLYGSATNYNSATDSIFVEVFWGDGTSTGDSVELYESGTTDYWYATNLSHSYALSGVYQVMVTATAYNGVADTFYWNDSINAAPGCTQFNGQVYVDQNANCTYDVGTDSTISSTIIVSDANGTVVEYAWANNVNGTYSFSLPNNLTNLSITASKYPAYTTHCPASGSYTFNSNTSQSFDFGIECDSMNLDKRAYVWGFAGAPGDTGVTSFSTYATYCSLPTNLQDTIILTLDSSVTYLGIPTWSNTPAPNVISGNTLTWYTNWTNTSTYWSTIMSGYIWTTTNTNATMYDTACFSVSFASMPSQEVNPSNNQNTWCWPIGVPYDPNNKLVFPQGEGPEGNIDTSIQRLTYMVNFQNTGTAPAEDVYVLDSLPAELDLESMVILETSHPMKLIHQENNRVRFDFPNIYLPDSASDEQGSKGYVMFSINRDPNLPIGTQIKNRVGIYFDYQPVVMTDYAINTLYVSPDDPDSLAIQVNPSDVTCIENDNGSIELDVLSGNAPYTYGWSNGSTTKNIKELSPGSYTVTVTDSEQLTAEATVEVGENRIHPAPIVGLINGPESVEAWKPYTYNILLNTGSAYNWMVDGGEVVDQANNQAEILWYGGPEGTITAIEKDLNGCTAQRDKVIPIEFVGVNEHTWNGLNVYPNPTNGLLNVQLPQHMKQAQLELRDMQGRLILQNRMNNTQSTLNLNQLGKGMYWLNIKGDTETKNVKVMVN